ncbi:MAG TPA: DUF3352 domain-containing protein [Solirubrobacteraceae bacterium]|nr:DUF3352 domain-containing protein [Solirubrobacteraceae bacterium]
MSIVTRARTTVPTVPERRLVLAAPAPRGPDRRRQFLRRRVALAGGLLALLIAIAAALLLSGSGEVPPATGAAQVVPADVLAYVHLSTDPSRPGVQRAQALARRFPGYPLAYAAALNRLSAIVVGGSSTVDFGTGSRAWLGREAAFAVLDTPGGSARSLIVLDVSNRTKARRFLTSAGAAPVASYDGVRVLGYRSGTELAFVKHFLVVGPDAGVRAAIAAGTGRSRSLVQDPVYERAAAGEAAGRVLDAYLPAAGVQRLLEPRGGVIGAVATLLDRPALQGMTLTVSADTGAADVRIHSALRTGRSHPYTFKPTLQSVLPAGSTLMLDVDGLGRAGPQLLQAAATAGFAGNVAPLLARLGAALSTEGVSLNKIASVFGGETAVAVSPGSSPSLVIVARTADQAATQTELAQLEAPLTALFPAPSSGPGQIPGLADHQVAGVTVHELGLGPGLQIDYAVFDRLVVVSTSISAIDQVVSRGRSLADEPAYKTALPSQPDRLTSVLFTDFSQLLRLGEQTGLTGSARVRELLPDLGKVRAIGLSSTSGERDATTELRLEIP